MNICENTDTWIVYRHTSPSGKVYIGISKNSPTRRWGNSGSGYKKYLLFGRAIAKYGWENIKHEVLFCGLSEKKAKQLEIDLIRHYKNLGISYNITDGGDGFLGYTPTEETREIWRLQRKGRCLTDEWKRKISSALKGRVIPKEVCIKAGKRTKDIKSKQVIQLSLLGDYINYFSCIKDAAKSLGNKKLDSDISRCCRGKAKSAHGFIWMYKEDYDLCKANGTLNNVISEKIRDEHTKNSYIKTKEYHSMLIEHAAKKNRKPVLQLSIEGTPLKVYPSIRSINLELGYDSGFIGHCCKGKYDKAYGYKWKFITQEEYDVYSNQLTA